MLSRRHAVCVALAASLISCDDGITDADRVTINLPTAADTIFKFASVQLTPIVTKGGAVKTVPITWTSSDTLVARVSSIGIVSGVGRGTALITARVESAQASSTIVVDSLREVRVAPSHGALNAGDSIRLVAIGVGELGTGQLDNDLTWVSSDISVAAVRANGTVIASRPGVITITASQHMVSGVASLSVLPANLNRQTACSGAGTLHQGSKSTDTWRAADNPHILLDSVIVGQLTVEPGSVICGVAGSWIVLRGSTGSPAWLVANGTADKPILFTAADTTKPWGGIDGSSGGFDGLTGSSATLAHTSIEHAGVIRGWKGSAIIHDSRLRLAGIRYCDQTFPSSVDIRRTVIDSAWVCLTTGIFEDNVIRGGRLEVLQNRNMSPLTINGGRIEDSPEVAFRMQRSGSFRDPIVNSSRPLRIIRSRSYPVDASLEGFVQIWPTRESQDSLLGNMNDTLSLWGNATTVTRPLYLRRDLPWKVETHGAYAPAGVIIDALTIETGASLTVGRLVAKGNVTALGTPDSPIKISTPTCDWCGLFLIDTASSQFSNVNFTGRTITANQQHQVTLQGINSTGFIDLRSSGSSIADSKIRNVPALVYGVGSPAGILISAPGVQVLRCDVTDNGGDGIRVTSGVSGGVEIHDCNLERNGGFGVNNLAGFTVDARRNWWGDPAGPNGPSGDGVSGNVDTSAHLPAPRP